VFNLQGSELIIILLLALVVLGPEKLPEAMRKMGQFYAELKKMSHGFQQEFRNATDEPMREIRETANALRDSVDFRKLSTGEREEKPKSAEMAAVTPTETASQPTHTSVAPADPTAVPSTDLPTGDSPFAAPAPESRSAESDAIGAPVLTDPVEVAPTRTEPVDIAPETLPPEGQVDDT